MAESIGAKIKNYSVLILIGLLVVAFAIWGVEDAFKPGVRNAVISIADESISTREFDRDLRRRLRDIAVQRGEGLTNEQAYRQGIHSELLGQYEITLAMEKDADDLGIGVNHRDAKIFIESFPVFQSSITGKFDENIYLPALSRNNLTEEDFEKGVLRDMKREQISEAVVGGIQAPAGYAERYFDYVLEQRKATVLTINKDAVPAPETPDDDTLQAYIETNGARYTAPEYRKVTMIRLEPQYFVPDLEVTEEEVRGEFDRRVEAGILGAPSTRDVVIISASDEATAQKAADRLSTEEEPELIAASLGLLAPETYDDIVPETIISLPTDELAFSLEAGEAKIVGNSLGGWDAVFIPDITPSTTPSFSTIESEIKNEIGQDKALDEIFSLQDSIDDLLLENKTIEEIAAELNLAMESYDFIDRTGTTQDGLDLTGSALIPGIASDDNLLRDIFTANIGLDSDIYETVHKGAVIFRVTDVIDSQLKPLDDIREQVTEAWTAEEIQKSLNERGVALATEINSGRTLEDLAEELGDAASLRERGISRANPPRDISGAVVVDLLASSEGDIARGTGAQSGTYEIARLDKILPNSDGIAGEILESRQRNISAEISLDIQNAYRLDILKEHKKLVYETEINRIMGVDNVQ